MLQVNVKQNVFLVLNYVPSDEDDGDVKVKVHIFFA
jgi:hypothetical protein